VLDRRLGWSVVTAMAAGAVSPTLAVLGAAVWWGGRWRAAQARRGHEQRVLDDHPDVVDLFLLAVDGGCNPRLAVEAVATWSAGPWRDALQVVVGRIAQGERLGTALGALTTRLGEPARRLVVALLDAEHYGVALVPSLERLAAESAVERRRRAEERARRVPVHLLFPLVFCTLPAFVLLTVVPLLAGTLPTLSP
jgi:tight adherence protein C